MSEQPAEQLMRQIEMLEAYFSDLSQREVSFMNMLREATASVKSIQSLGTNAESETLVPIGMGTFIPTKISSASKIIVHIGASVAVEKDFPSTINYLEARIKEIEVALQDTVAKKQDISARLEQGKIQMEQLMPAMQSPPQSSTIE